MSWLVVDVGNSEIVFGLYAQGAVRMGFRMTTPRAATADELAAQFSLLAAHAFGTPPKPRAVVVASVVPALEEALRAGLQAAFAAPVRFVGDAQARPRMPIAYARPEELGADRLANAVAARARFGAPVIVADLGTATTLDVVDAEGAYAGGAILPGLAMQMRALAEGTARLVGARLAPPADALGRTTEESLRVGVVLGTACALEGLVARMREALGSHAPLVLTGGRARMIAALLAEPAPIVPELTLEGIGRIAEEAGL